MLENIRESGLGEGSQWWGIPRRTWEVTFGGQGWRILVSDPPWHLFGPGRSDNSAVCLSVRIRYAYPVPSVWVARDRSGYLPAADHLQMLPQSQVSALLGSPFFPLLTLPRP